MIDRTNSGAGYEQWIEYSPPTSSRSSIGILSIPKNFVYAYLARGEARLPNECFALVRVVGFGKNSRYVRILKTVPISDIATEKERFDKLVALNKELFAQFKQEQAVIAVKYVKKLSLSEKELAQTLRISPVYLAKMLTGEKYDGEILDKIKELAK